MTANDSIPLRHSRGQARSPLARFSCFELSLSNLNFEKKRERGGGEGSIKDKSGFVRHSMKGMNVPV